MIAFLNRIAERLLPSFLYHHAIGAWDKEGLKKYFHNTGWLFFGKAFSMVVSFFMIAVIARYLGPEHLGRLSYAQSFVAIFSMFASLGINHLLFRDLVENPQREREILGTAFFIKLVFGTLTTIATTAIALFTNADPTVTLIIFILSLAFITEPFGITFNVFSAEVRSKYSVISQIIVTVVMPLLKLLVIFFGKGIIFFAGIIIFEIMLSALIAMVFYVKVFGRNPLRWRVDFAYGRKLIKDSLPMLCAGVSGYLFSRIDQVMLMHFLGATSVGLYQGAVQITDMMAGAIPGIIIGSFIPALINAKKVSVHEYFLRMRRLLIMIVSISFAIIASISIVAPYLVALLYGEAFSATAGILRIYIWSSLLYMGIVILQQHLIIENRTLTFFFLSAGAATINVLLNVLLIPLYGTYGAAFATLIALLAYLIAPLALRHTRRDYKTLFSIRAADGAVLSQTNK